MWNAGPVTRHLETLRQLEEQDRALAAEISELIALEETVAELRAEAERIALNSSTLPVLRERAALEARVIEAEIVRRNDAVRAAEEMLATAKDEDAREYAERAVATARTALADAEARLARGREDAERLEADAQRAVLEIPRLETRAGELARSVDVEPEPGLDGIERWGARARAAIFAKRTHAEGERAQVLHEAAEIGSSALGEPMFSGSVSAVRSRVEAASKPG